MKILILEFITTVGGVQSVYKNLIKELSQNQSVFFLDPYEHAYDSEILANSNAKLIRSKINIPKSLSWNESITRNIKVTLIYGFQYLRYVFVLRRVVRENKIDIVYVSGKKEIFLAYLLKIINGTNYLYHAHGFKSSMDISWMYKKAIMHAGKVICVSGSVKTTLIKAGVNEALLEVVYNGVDCIHKERNHDRMFESSEMRIIFVGSIQEKKNLKLLVEAVGILLNEGLDLKLYIVGDAPSIQDQKYKNEVILLSEKYGIDNFIYFGYRSHPDQIMRECDLLVLPSSEESFGMVIVEAMNLGLAVIGSDVGGIPEVIIDNESGLLFKNDVVTDLTDKIRLLYFDRELMKRLSINGAKRVSEHFSASAQSEKISMLISMLGSKYSG